MLFRIIVRFDFFANTLFRISGGRAFVIVATLPPAVATAAVKNVRLLPVDGQYASDSKVLGSRKDLQAGSWDWYFPTLTTPATPATNSLAGHY